MKPWLPAEGSQGFLLVANLDRRATVPLYGACHRNPTSQSRKFVSRLHRPRPNPARRHRLWQIHTKSGKQTFDLFPAFLCCGGSTRTNDLQVMSLASYQLLHSAMFVMLSSPVFRSVLSARRVRCSLFASAKVRLFSLPPRLRATFSTYTGVIYAVFALRKGFCKANVPSFVP